MLRPNREKQQSYEFVSIEDLVPGDHLLRKIDKYIDFSFIDEKVRPLYCADNGRPAIDPVILFKMIFLGYFYGIRSERQLEREIQTNLAYRWFLGLGLTDKVPDHTTISWNRRTRFKDTNFPRIFSTRLFSKPFHTEWSADVSLLRIRLTSKPMRINTSTPNKWFCKIQRTMWTSSTLL
jgi:transposase